jgi:hypothetical protein
MGETLYHLWVQDVNRQEFWLDLEIGGSKTLQDLDKYLRTIWLECCGHLSQFSTGSDLERQLGMRRKISEAFPFGKGELIHIYDLTNPSETLVKCLGKREGKPTTHHPVVLLARNLPPQEQCIHCERLATHFCLECLIEAKVWGTLCDEHTLVHPHEDYGEPILIANSPRFGLCQYRGPAKPPY